MRTTLTIEDDIAAELENLRKARRCSLNAVVNEALRRGLRDMSTQRKARGPFRTRSVDLGRSRLADIDKVAEALAILEGDAFK